MTRTKRIVDVLGASAGLVVLSPLFLALAILIKLSDGGPVFFLQERIGKGGRPFRLRKFRTMVPNAERIGGQLTVGGDARITPMGRRLRGTKLDELPQLLNVLVGEMSLVGPRPEVPRYVALYNAEQRKVLALTPGITDPASVRYRDESDQLARASDPETEYVQTIMPEKLRINMKYASESNVWKDLVVILQTVKSLVLGSGSDAR